MFSARSLLLNTFILAVTITVGVYVYQTYKEDAARYFFGEQKVGIFIRDIPLVVSIADTPEERATGLSGLSSLSEREGKLFVFNGDGHYGFWMKDMLISIDIIWLDVDGEVVHIEKNITPDTYPTVYSPPVEARYVLEVNAFFAETFNVEKGDKVTLPADLSQTNS